ncbi:MAG: dTDP-4-dehydrorhamnose reductase [Firmicutes bacterium]|nr:dTDP-4-dehydrorhamnose reductase [Bacillota bacterium]
MRVVVLGAGGMLGRDVVRVLGGCHEVTAATRRDCDVTDLDQVVGLVRRVGPDVVINAAAFTKVDACETETATAYAVNALGARNAAVASRRVGAALVHFSTDYVFDGLKGAPYDEFDPPAPLSVYGRSKLAGESLVRSLCPEHYIVRTQWLYGRGGTNFVATIRRLARGGAQLRVVDDQFGSPTWTQDLAAAVARLIERPRYGTYHLTNSGECSWFEFAQEIVGRVGLEGHLLPVSSSELDRPARRPAYSVLDNLVWRLEGEPPLRHYREALAEFLSPVDEPGGATEDEGGPDGMGGGSR